MTSEATRHVMQANKSTDTGPELLLRHALRDAGLPGYRLHWKKAPGRPDICYPGRKVAIFVNGCFWHRCPHCDLPSPKTNIEFWSEKFSRNRTRDRRVWRELVDDGWWVLVIWECRLKKAHLEGTIDEVTREVRTAGEAPRHPGRLVEVGSPAAWTYQRRARTRRG